MQVDGHQHTVSDVSIFYEAFLRVDSLWNLRDDYQEDPVKFCPTDIKATDYPRKQSLCITFWV